MFSRVLFILIVIGTSFTVVGKLHAQEIDHLLTPQLDDYIVGDEKAPITVIEYASLSCSHCARFHMEVYPEIKKNYIDTGKVKFIYRDFPLNQPALKASLLARCAGKNRYYNFLTVLFDTQENWAFDKHYIEKLYTIGKLGGLGQTKIDTCFADEAMQESILQARLEAAKSLNIDSTPTVFVNGEKFIGSKDYAYFVTLFDKLLAKE